MMLSNVDLDRYTNIPLLMIWEPWANISHISGETRSVPNSVLTLSWTASISTMTDHNHLHSEAIHSSGPLNFLHPTTRYHPATVTPREQQQQQHEPKTFTEKKHTSQVYHVWRSRDNRKGRHRAVITGQGPKPRDATDGKSRLRKTALGLARLVTRFPVWDVSYLVAVAFVLG